MKTLKRDKSRASSQSAWWSAGLAVLGMALVLPSSAQTPADPYSYSRAVSYTYDTAGRVLTETVEPDNPALCVVNTYGYDVYGNKNSATIANCAGAIPTRQQFATRTAGADYAPATTPTATINGTTFYLAKGLYPYGATNALGHIDKFEYDPRFGAAIKVTAASGLISKTTFDDFGRKTRTTGPDGTSTIYRYCYITGRVSDLTSNTSGCDGNVPAEAPADAVSYVHSEPRDTADAKMGPSSRIYADRLGREIRSATESFDGPGQPTALAASLIVKDTVYSAQGSKLMETQPYFLATGSSTATGSQDVGVTLTRYDAMGRPTALYAADINGLGGSGDSFNRDGGSFGYANYGSRTISSTRYNYAGSSTTLINDKGQQRVDEKNAIGLLVRVTDEAGGQLAHQYDAFNNLLTSKDALQNITALQYDIRGRKVQLNDPDSGIWKYDYDPLGQLVWQENPNQRAASTAITMVYDKLGRMTSRSEPEGTGAWTYDANLGNGMNCFKGALCASSYARAGTSDTRTNATAYDSYGRVARSLTTVTGTAPGPAMASGNTYDATTGRLLNKTYPTGLQVAYNYTTRGFVKQMTLPANATVSPLPATAGGTPGVSVNLGAGSSLWQVGIINAWGKIEQSTRGNGVVSRGSYEAATGRTTALNAGTGTTKGVVDYSFAWDSLNNLIYRADNIGDAVAGAVTENFEYGDALTRLTKYTVNAAGVPGGSRVVNLQYNALGMLLSKSDVGTYTYPTAGSARPHALSTLNAIEGATTSFGYDAAGNLTSASNGKYRSVTYTSFNLPDSQSGIVGEPGGAYGGTATHTWVYDENRARIKEVRTITGGSQAGTRTLWYLHPDNAGALGFESEVNSPTTPTANNPAQTTNRHFLSVGGQSIGVIITLGNLPTPGSDGSLAGLSSVTIKRLEYWHKDHLGSLLATTDHAAQVTQRYAYDPFGKRRQVNGSYDAFGAIVIDWGEAVNAGTNRGYTGHEHLDDIGLIHMNGRIFDPRLGLFLQPDQRIQEPKNLQNYNRYAYCLNNPLTCTDPTGMNFILTKQRLASSGSIVQSVATVRVGASGGQGVTMKIASSGSDFESYQMIVDGGWSNCWSICDYLLDESKSDDGGDAFSSGFREYNPDNPDNPKEGYKCVWPDCVAIGGRQDWGSGLDGDNRAASINLTTMGGGWEGAFSGVGAVIGTWGGRAGGAAGGAIVGEIVFPPGGGAVGATVGGIAGGRVGGQIGGTVGRAIGRAVNAILNSGPKKDGEGSTPEEVAASSGGPTAGRPVRPSDRQRILDRDKGDDGKWRCWRCGWKSEDPEDFDTGHKNVPKSKGGNLTDGNLACEGQSCNRSAGNRGEVKPGRDCMGRSCSKP
ncbi:RHS repeat-associated core domain-containing protein [Roseateles sp.]|uniref:RHS repeat-associated core domain-containing protein n=1 Tax=Roseateles sp. TaxID=1971397 RepID=UPI0039EC7706